MLRAAAGVTVVLFIRCYLGGTSQDPSHSIRQIVNLRRTRTQGTEFRACVPGTVEESLASQRRGTHLLNPANSDGTVGFVNAWMELAFTPESKRRARRGHGRQNNTGLVEVDCYSGARMRGRYPCHSPEDFSPNGHVSAPTLRSTAHGP